MIQLLEGPPAKAKEAPYPYVLRLSSPDTSLVFNISIVCNDSPICDEFLDKYLIILNI